ncbi:hypothetical protein [Streptomyces sp. H27-C3]|uniref:hypothetical protein n=1 Tax=Streptomyces sp. H27-C3 TaxID=3046305 RepID=UPI0024B9F25E|nr:hypothetical protein [Streptomyces sp. H27-C3]MDJ0465361.1 hypothetical protein [Streptomyces sp. H27-C3]
MNSADEPTHTKTPMVAMSLRARFVAVGAATVLLATLGVVHAVNSAHRTEPADGAQSVLSLGDGPAVFFRTDRGRLASVSRPAGGKGGSRGKAKESAMPCHRFYAGGATAVCLATRPGIPPRTKAVILDRDLKEKRGVLLPGVPNRARVSASGRMVAWTVFVTGDSYSSSSFSTRSGILDTRTGYLIKNMETIQVYRDGKRYHSSDVNFWGVTFARDDNRFFATMATRGKTYLVEGDMKKWSAHTVRENVECPSLSPDNTRIAFKKRVSGGGSAPWRLHVLDLRTMRETPLAETRSVDDQVAWLDDRTLAYAVPGRTARSSAVWTVPADGSGRAELTVPGASSPSAVSGG